MDLRSLEDLLRELGAPDIVIRHSRAVSKVAEEISRKLMEKGYDIDLEAVLIGAILHDIGRIVSMRADHGYIGAEMLRKLGYPEKIARIVERHVGGGLSREEARELGIPERDYIPETLEEKIVCYADKLVYIDRRVEIDETIRRFEKELGKNHPGVERVRKLRDEIEQMLRDP